MSSTATLLHSHAALFQQPRSLRSAPSPTIFAGFVRANDRFTTTQSPARARSKPSVSSRMGMTTRYPAVVQVIKQNHFPAFTGEIIPAGGCGT